MPTNPRYKTSDTQKHHDTRLNKANVLISSFRFSKVYWASQWQADRGLQFTAVPVHCRSQNIQPNARIRTTKQKPTKPKKFFGSIKPKLLFCCVLIGCFASVNFIRLNLGPRDRVLTNQKAVKFFRLSMLLLNWQQSNAIIIRMITGRKYWLKELLKSVFTFNESGSNKWHTVTYCKCNQRRKKRKNTIGLPGCSI